MILYYTNDPYEIKLSLLKDDLYKNIYPDANDPEWVPISSLEWYLIYSNKKEQVGICCLQHFNKNISLFHGGIYKKFRSKNTYKMFIEVLEKIKKLYDERIFIFPITESNKAAINIVEKSGYKKQATIFNSGTNENLFLFW